jgi:hypothetical protein
MICAFAAFSQEAVGKIIVKEPNIGIEIDFYDDNVSIDIIIELIKTCIITTKSNRLRTVEPEIAGFLIEEIGKRVSVIDFSKNKLEWGYSTEYSTISFSFSYKGKEYFVIGVMPEDRYWYFENER